MEGEKYKDEINKWRENLWERVVGFGAKTEQQQPSPAHSVQNLISFKNKF